MGLTDILRTFQEDKVVEKEGHKFVEKDADGISIKGVLQRGRLKLGKKRKPHKQGLTFRPSSITYPFCERIKVAQLAGLVELYDTRATPKQQFTFDMGNAIHDIVQGYYWDIGILKGSFKCLKCDTIYHDLVAPTACPSGVASHKRSHMKYKEVIAKNEDYLISGRCDGILVIDGEEHILDIKSIQNRVAKSSDRQFCFEDLEVHGPKQDHIVQLNLYMWIMNIHKGHLFYVAKNDHQIKTYAIPYDHDVIEPYLNKISNLLNLSLALKQGQLKAEELPPPCGRKDCKCETVTSKGIFAPE